MSIPEIDTFYNKADNVVVIPNSNSRPPCPEGLSYYPYQEEGIKFARGKVNTLIADEMGLGKTPQGIGIINDNPSFKNILIIVPASLKLNWERECNKWLVNKELSVGVGQRSSLPTTNIAIVNYDVLTKISSLRLRDWDMVLIDEAHYIKNAKAARTREICGFRKVSPLKAKKNIMLTGTPMTNSPIDLWTICKYMDPITFNNEWAYLNRYCDPKKKFGEMIYDGAANLDELSQKLSKFMIRRFKKDVLPDLPPKHHTVVEFDSMGKQQKLIKSEIAMVDFVDTADKVKIAFQKTAEVRRELGESKVPKTVKRLKDMQEQSGEKIVVFAHHRSVIEEISQDLGNCAVIFYGGMSSEDKQSAVDRFNNDPSCKYFIGSIAAAGVGITLTSSSTVVFAELSYVPAEMLQAEDRVHRIGQTADLVNIYFFVYRNSLDANIAHKLVKKQQVIKQTVG